MPNYRVYFREERQASVMFEAETLEEAKELLRQVNDGQIYLEELPNSHQRTRSADYIYEGVELLP